MRFTLCEIAKLVNGELIGDPEIVITGISGIKEATEGDITFLANSKYFPLMRATGASAVITSREDFESSKPLIKTENPSLAFAKVADLVSPSCAQHPKGIHPTAVISDKASLGKNVAVGAYTVIEDDAKIQDGTIIYSGCFVGLGSKIGKNCLIYPNVSILERTEIGDRVIIHSGTVIGSDGFGFAMVKGIQKKIPQIGTVLIKDDVEIGANVTIDRARFDKTIIGRATKIDNLVQIGHNVVTGENCIIVAQAAIAGSVTLGKEVILAGQVGIAGHLHIGDKAVVAGQSGVMRSVAPGEKVFGYPAKPHMEAKRIEIALRRLPDLYKKIKELEMKIKDLEKKGAKE